jgi:hypothetical protein
MSNHRENLNARLKEIDAALSRLRASQPANTLRDETERKMIGERGGVEALIRISEIRERVCRGRTVEAKGSAQP